MGASLIERTVKARNINEAWKQVYEDAQEYSGHQEGYSGDFNTCEFSKDVTNLVMTKGSKLDDYISDNCNKREAWGYCLSQPIANKNKIKTQVDVTPQKGTRKWETIYKAVTSWDNDEIARDKSQTNCIKKARLYVEKNPGTRVNIIIAKELAGNSQCATVIYKKSTTEKLGLYKFVGWAAD